MSRRKAIAAQTRIELLLTLRRGESLLVTLAIPLGILVFFSKVDAVNTSYNEPVDFLVPGVLALAVMSTAMVSLGIATGYERRYGVLKRLGSTPLSRAGLLAAKTVQRARDRGGAGGAIVVTGIALGWEPTGGLLPAIVLLLMGTVAFAGIGMLMAGTLRAEANLAVANGLFLRAAVPRRHGVPARASCPTRSRAFAKALPAAALSGDRARACSHRAGRSPSASWSCCSRGRSPRRCAAARWFRWEE